jgi:hypothetical protein
MDARSRYTVLGLLSIVPSSASVGAQGVPPTVPPWTEDFDNTALYFPGQDPTQPSVGGWERNGFLPATGAEISSAHYRSAPHALKNGGDSDIVQKFGNTASAPWRFETSLYLAGPGHPDEVTVETWFIMLNTFSNAVAAPKLWSLQLGFDPATNQVRYLGGPNQGLKFPFVRDAWMTLVVEMDLTQPPGSANAQALLDTGAGLMPLGPPFDWSEGVSSNGKDELQAIDLWSNVQTMGTNPAGAAYYDDFRLDDPGAPLAFCTPKAGLACGVPWIQWSGTPSATATSGFVLRSGPARSNKTGLLLYNQAVLTSAIPFQGGSLCIDPVGLRRAGPTNSLGGCNPKCNGIFALDMSAFTQGAWQYLDCGGMPAGPATNPASFLTSIGIRVWAQFWGRDSVATGSYLSSGLTWLVGP